MIHIVTHVNPEPWAVGKAYAARTRSGTMRGGISPNKKLQSYQKALRESLSGEPGVKIHEPGDSGLILRLWFWRQIEVASRGGKKVSGHIADVTNLQKSTEDALQGVLFKNDNSVRFVLSEIVEQELSTVPTIAIEVQPYPTESPDPMTESVAYTRQQILEALERDAEREYLKRNAW